MLEIRLLITPSYFPVTTTYNKAKSCIFASFCVIFRVILHTFIRTTLMYYTNLMNNYKVQKVNSDWKCIFKWLGWYLKFYIKIRSNQRGGYKRKFLGFFNLIFFKLKNVIECFDFLLSNMSRNRVIYHENYNNLLPGSLITFFFNFVDSHKIK